MVKNAASEALAALLAVMVLTQLMERSEDRLEVALQVLDSLAGGWSHGRSSCCLPCGLVPIVHPSQKHVEEIRMKWTWSVEWLHCGLKSERKQSILCQHCGFHLLFEI